eukprot:1934433-Karenia_brevis.AAC.1
MARCVRDHVLNNEIKKKIEKKALHVQKGRATRIIFSESLEKVQGCSKNDKTPTGACAQCNATSYHN